MSPSWACMRDIRRLHNCDKKAWLPAGNGYEKVKQDKEWQQQAMIFLPHTSSRPAAIEAV